MRASGPHRRRDAAACQFLGCDSQGGETPLPTLSATQHDQLRVAGWVMASPSQRGEPRGKPGVFRIGPCGVLDLLRFARLLTSPQLILILTSSISSDVAWGRRPLSINGSIFSLQILESESISWILPPLDVHSLSIFGKRPAAIGWFTLQVPFAPASFNQNCGDALR